VTTERIDFIRDADGFEIPDVHSSSADYATRFTGNVGTWLLKVQRTATESLLDGFPAGAVLDVGGGHGQNIPALLERGDSTVVLGSGSQCPGLIKQWVDRGEIFYRKGPLTKLPFPDDSFDLVLSYRMLTHLQDWKVHIAELCRVARGPVLVEYPVLLGFNVLSGMLFKAKRGIEGNTRQYTVFRRQQVLSAFAWHEFEERDRQHQFFWPMAAHRLHGSASLGRLMEVLPARLRLTKAFGSPVISRFDRTRP
jgi:SAM-dependent methyltransferase